MTSFRIQKWLFWFFELLSKPAKYHNQVSKRGRQNPRRRKTNYQLNTISVTDHGYPAFPLSLLLLSWMFLFTFGYSSLLLLVPHVLPSLLMLVSLYRFLVKLFWWNLSKRTFLWLFSLAQSRLPFLWFTRGYILVDLFQPLFRLWLKFHVIRTHSNYLF